MLNAGCIFFGILAISGGTADSTPPDYHYYYDYDRHNRHHIIGGTPTDITEFPSTVYVSKQINALFYTDCAGSIVTKYWIVTAGHCVEDAQPTDITITAGTTNWNTGGKTYKAHSFRIHERFQKTGKTRAYDIACVKVLTGFDLDGTSIALTSLPKDGHKVVTGDKLVMVGWIVSGLGPRYSSARLHKVDVNVMDQHQCSQRFHNVTVPDYMFCTDTFVNGLHRGGMSGDSGGPLFDGHTLVGMHVSGFRSPALACPDKNIRISTFKQWILETTAE